MSATRQSVEISPRAVYFPDLGEAWRFRGLLWTLVRRNVMVRYKQTLLGGAWAIFQPLLMAGLLTVIAGILLKAPSGGSPYALFAFAGTSIWNVFQRALNDSSSSFAGNSNLILKVYFPRIFVPIASAATALVDFLPVFALLEVTVFLYGRFSSILILVAPLFVALSFLLALSAGLWITVIDALYRDLRVLIPTFLQALLFLSPIMYAPSAIPAKWQSLYALNPLVPILQGFRWTVISGAEPPTWPSIASAVAVTIVLLVSGLHIFARLERSAVDRI